MAEPPRKRQKRNNPYDFPYVSSGSSDDNSDVNSEAPEESEAGSRNPPADDTQDLFLMRSLFTDDRVKLIFSNDDTEYTFAKDFLTSKFEYFEKALRPERWTEGQEQVVRFDHITVQTFASIHKWVTAQHINDPQCKITYWGWGMDLTERKLEHLFNLALAADYLAMRAYDPFEAWLNEGIALTLFEDRAALTQDLLDLVAGPDAHPRFGQSCLFWKTFVAAGVRPAMQDHMRFQQDKTVASAPACGHEDGYAAWDEALAYCSRLRKRSRNAHYAAAVLREINVTMREGRHQWTNWGWAAGPRERSWQVFDPLCEVIVSKAECLKHVPVEFWF